MHPQEYILLYQMTNCCHLKEMPPYVEDGVGEVLMSCAVHYGLWEERAIGFASV